jgi:hypothetical protein
MSTRKSIESTLLNTFIQCSDTEVNVTGFLVLNNQYNKVTIDNRVCRYKKELFL